MYECFYDAGIYFPNEYSETKCPSLSARHRQLNIHSKHFAKSKSFTQTQIIIEKAM